MTGKTLKELNVQVGDVVEHLQFEDGGSAYPHKSIHCIRDGYYGVAAYEDVDKKCNQHFRLDSGSKFRIISRAAKYTDWKFGTAPDGADTHVMPDGSVAWRVKVEPVKRDVRLYFGKHNALNYISACDTHRITFTTIDGVPDCESVKMEVL